MGIERISFKELVEERKNCDTNIANMKVGDRVVCFLELGHDYIEYEMIVTCVNPNDFEEDEDGNLHIVAFGEGATEDDVDFVETEAGCRIDETNFCFIKCVNN